jgi:Polyketide cyclase / dehydrase and lipid transport
MLRIEGEIVIDRPVDEVFDFVADARNEPLYNPRMLRADKLSPGPVGLGSQFRDEIKSMGRPAEITIEIIEYERPRRLTDSIRLSMMDIRGGLTFDPVAAGTRMRWSWDLMPRGVFKVMSPIVARIGRRQEQRIWASLKRLLEADAAPTSISRVTRDTPSVRPKGGLKSLRNSSQRVRTRAVLFRLMLDRSCSVDA